MQRAFLLLWSGNVLWRLDWACAFTWLLSLCLLSLDILSNNLCCKNLGRSFHDCWILIESIKVILAGSFVFLALRFKHEFLVDEIECFLELHIRSRY